MKCKPDFLFPAFVSCCSKKYWKQFYQSRVENLLCISEMHYTDSILPFTLTLSPANSLQSLNQSNKEAWREQTNSVALPIILIADFPDCKYYIEFIIPLPAAPLNLSFFFIYFVMHSLPLLDQLWLAVTLSQKANADALWLFFFFPRH